jgi:hypothetical protein
VKSCIKNLKHLKSCGILGGALSADPPEKA